jgi:hypothetical protein
MSKGFGLVQRKLAAIFDSNPDDAFRVDELCWKIYGDDGYLPEKKQRVAVIRAAKGLVAKRADLDWIGSSGPGHSLVFYHWASVMSYARARLKTWGCRLDGEYGIDHRLSPGGYEYENYLKEGGQWWLDVQEQIAKETGDAALQEKLQPLIKEREAKFAAAMTMLRGG